MAQAKYEEEAKEQEEKMEEMYEQLKVFKDCTFEEFQNIFGPKFDESLPLYSNLYALKTFNEYVSLVELMTHKNSLISIIGMNLVYYYALRSTLFRG